ncbi:RNA degradosome polyphosphate kinase [Domibacillus sp. PGB-M46]|uniref:RNA degradosome polyphosphate kinase n=1 Tax=Domibacillus sp. PGB-M46 TaxID=2910255 RepID=UPI001F57B703|nr:RNA degradosome polyphosphate kinase [Domibacillus sp. PGB-M46]MCI2253270.1 RNA degradosome polyphosphate kinase [Domibacillus sp. PGB-M46]
MSRQTAIDLANPRYYNNRELSWLNFNKRVLEESSDLNNPLLERMKFLAIFSSNLDEFFMVRVAGLKDQVKAGFNKPENKAGLTPKQQLNRISIKAHELVETQNRILREEILPALKEEGFLLKKPAELVDEQQRFLLDYFDNEVFPVLTPMAIDAYRPFPMLLNKSLNLVVMLQNDEPEAEMDRVAIVQVPGVLERTIEVPSEEGGTFVLLEDVLEYFIDRVFQGYVVKNVNIFRITRNADMEIHEEGARDLLLEIEKELKKRKWGAAVRLEIKSQDLDQDVLDYLLEELEIHFKDVYEIDGPIDLTFLFPFTKKLSTLREGLTYETFIPQLPIDLSSRENIFEKVLQQDILFYHPYESFEPVVDFISQAADDPTVLAIKMTLYRVSGDSPIIESLKRAAEKGKQVTVLVELKARFDEENNVQWAKELEKAGCHVIYGMHNLKTHSKITLVVRKRAGQIERFVHLGTGNYNDATAKLYTDHGLITSKKEFGVDATNFFNYLSGYMNKPKYNHLVVAPFDIQDAFIKLIDEEIDNHKKYGNGRIIAKMNSLTDKRLIMKLYEASNAGVQIDCIIRGICCMRPGIPGVSENIRVISIVGRFLEHSRIYYFHHNGERNIYLSSADMMTRNMIKRVEILFPILDHTLKNRLTDFLHLQLSDTAKARYQDNEGNYHYVASDKDEIYVDSQLECLQAVYQLREDEE